MIPVFPMRGRFGTGRTINSFAGDSCRLFKVKILQKDQCVLEKLSRSIDSLQGLVIRHVLSHFLFLVVIDGEIDLPSCHPYNPA